MSRIPLRGMDPEFDKKYGGQIGGVEETLNALDNLLPEIGNLQRLATASEICATPMGGIPAEISRTPDTYIPSLDSGGMRTIGDEGRKLSDMTDPNRINKMIKPEEKVPMSNVLVKTPDTQEIDYNKLQATKKVAQELGEGDIVQKRGEPAKRGKLLSVDVARGEGVIEYEGEGPRAVSLDAIEPGAIAASIKTGQEDAQIKLTDTEEEKEEEEEEKEEEKEEKPEISKEEEATGVEKVEEKVEEVVPQKSVYRDFLLGILTDPEVAPRAIKKILDKLGLEPETLQKLESKLPRINPGGIRPSYWGSEDGQKVAEAVLDAIGSN